VSANGWAAVNGTVRFGLELTALAALGAWGWHVTTGGLAILLAVGVPLIAMTVWGRFVAPRAPHYLGRPGRLIVEAGVFGAAALALAGNGHAEAAIAFGLVAAVNTALVHACRHDEQARAAAAGAPPHVAAPVR
jgi:hypothetical protein